MRCPGLILLAAVGMTLMSCARTQDTSSGGKADTTTAQAPDSSARAVMLVAELPAGIEGVELAREGLRVKEGYHYAQETDSTFAIIRTSDGRKVSTGGCGCPLINIGCIPLRAPGGIIVCSRFVCSPCGLRVTAGGLQVEVVRYEKP